MQFPMLGRVSGEADLTKMFHVKHFCPIGAENLTRPKTAISSQSGKIVRFFGTKEIARRQRLSSITGLRQLQRQNILHRNYAPKKS
jgi:hypothetical protein